MKIHPILCAIVALLGVVMSAHRAHAAVIGQSCSAPGATAMSDDQLNGMMCLSNGSGSFVWKQITGTPQPVANRDGKPVAHFSDNGSLVWNPPAPKSEPAAATPATPALATSAPFNWQGWFVGGNFGGGMGGGTIGDGCLNVCGTDSFDQGFITAGAQAGYNWQRGSAVFGFVGDADWSSFEYSNNNYFDQAKTKSSLDWRVSMRARVGLAVDDAFLYVSAGPALGHTFAYYKGYNNPGTVSKKAVDDGWRLGVAATIGGEYMLDKHWSIGGEYLLIDLVQTSQHVDNMPGTNGESGREEFTQRAHIARVGVNYHF
jgi:outer membrane immunogenic protein